MSASTAPRLYFAYGSNLWLQQMSKRCPSSPYVGVARLPAYRWIINDRGYANVVASATQGEEVWGMAYELRDQDEETLDVNEGVPECYEKLVISVELWPSSSASERVDIRSVQPEWRDMLVYVDRGRIEPAQPRAEYIHRMNFGLSDALACGVPASYIDDTVRKFIPTEGDPEELERARKQAAHFEDALEV
ncbi:hypothetical protein PENSPDRAFT_655946 [Peniophora sp. CONT]|nr:hypothetical protein PENSPDRAFT_655946 [Peniophora sp. CONT]